MSPLCVLGDVTNTRQSTGGPWADMQDAFTQRINELKRFMHLRVEDRSKNSFEQDLLGLEASVKAVEELVNQLRTHIRNETATIPKVEALLEALKLQSQDLNHITANLPAHLPAANYAAPPPRGMTVGSTHNSTTTAVGRPENAKQGDDSTTTTRANKKPEAPPKWYISQSELDGVSSYMKGRLTLEKINTAVDELAGMAATNHKHMIAARSQGSKLTGPERKRATDLLHSVANKEGIKGKYWFLESDLRDGVSIKLDKTGRSILTVLRHLGRVGEQRCNTDAGPAVVFTMNTQ